MLVLPPLIVTLIFSYGFVLMQPHPRKDMTTASSQEHGSQSTYHQTTLPVISYSKQTTLTTVPVPEPSSNSQAAASNTTTVSSQSSTNDRDSLQAASSSDGTGMTIKVPQSVSTTKPKVSTKDKRIKAPVTNVYKTKNSLFHF
jgi:hypothetical protein